MKVVFRAVCRESPKDSHLTLDVRVYLPADCPGMDAVSPLPAIKRSDASNLARYPKMTGSPVSCGKKRSLVLIYLDWAPLFP